MVEIDKILSERSDEKILKALKEISDQEFNRLVESVLSFLELKTARSRPKGTFYIAECVHTPDGKKYVVFFSRRDEVIAKGDIESLVAYMKKVESPNGLVLTTSSIAPDGVGLAEENNVGLADASKLAALLRRFDLDKEVIHAAEIWKERAKAAKIPGANKQIEEAMRAGYEALISKDYMKALDRFDNAIMLKEDYDVAWRMKGNALDEMGYHEQALECYKRALELSPESDETWFSLGVCLFSLGRYTEEISSYDRALQYNPTMQKALINKGSTLHRLGRFKEALEAYDAVLKINYRLEKVHNNRGATLHALGQANEALLSYNRALELRKDYVEAWMNKGSLLYELGRYGEAFDAFTQMTHVRPELPKGWYLRGLTARKTGNITAAKASFEAAIRLDPDYADAKKALEDVSKKIAEKYVEAPRIVKDIFDSDAARVGEPAAKAPAEEAHPPEKMEALAEELYGDRAELLLLMGRSEEAFDYLGRSLRLEGENPSLLTAAGNVLYGLGKTEAAIRTYEHALAADPGCAPAMLNLHTLLLESREGERAAKVSESLRKSVFGWQARAAAAIEAFGRKDYRQAVEDLEFALAKENISSLLNFEGLIKIDADDLDGALATFEKTKGMPMDSAEAFNNAGVVLLKKGELEKASMEFDRAIKMQRTSHPAWNNRGCVLYRLERLREAIACFDESMVMMPTTVAFSNKGFSQLALDLLPESLKSFESSLQVAETPEAYNSKGIVLTRMGRRGDAQVAFNEALRLAPQFKDAADNARGTPSRKEPVTGGPTPQQAPPPPPPGEEVVGDKNEADAVLAGATEDSLRAKRKTELESMCESLGLDSHGTRADLVLRLLRVKEQRAKK